MSEEGGRPSPTETTPDTLTADPTVPPRGKQYWIVVDGEWHMRSNLRRQVDAEYARWERMHLRRGPLDRHIQHCGWRDAA